MALFSKRHKRALASGELRVALEGTLRVRIWRLMQRYEDNYLEEGDYTSHLEQLQRDLLDIYGASRFSLEREEGIYEYVSFEPWFQYGPAYGVLDAVEGYKRHIGGWEAFRSSLNDILSEEESNWRLLDSEFVLLDPVFVHENIVGQIKASVTTGLAQSSLTARGVVFIHQR